MTSELIIPRQITPDSSKTFIPCSIKKNKRETKTQSCESGPATTATSETAVAVEMAEEDIAVVAEVMGVVTIMKAVAAIVTPIFHTRNVT